MHEDEGGLSSSDSMQWLLCCFQLYDARTLSGCNRMCIHMTGPLARMRSVDFLARKFRAGVLCAGEPELAVAPHCLHRPIDVFTQVITLLCC